MSNEDKVALVHGVRSEFGVVPALKALRLPRSTWYYWVSERVAYQDKYSHLRRLLEKIATSHPEYGYRRTTTELQETYGLATNHKVVRRLHRLWGLPLVRSTRTPRRSGVQRVIGEIGDKANLVGKLDEIGPLEVVYTDFTELVYAHSKAQLIVLVDHCTKLALGWAVGPSANAEAALKAWRVAKALLRRFHRSAAGLIVHHDRDSVFTGLRWTSQLLLRDRVRLSYALRGAKDNPEMESFNSRFKNENRSLLVEARDLAELQTVVARRIRYYNRQRRHSSLRNQAPWSFASKLLGRPRSR